ncbi:hypothetical protein QBC39DRAFT_150692 [Podospora conica]|nr:hypothetical protein QBC39DRAFT_150692 [Schizothecium conicum]
MMKSAIFRGGARCLVPLCLLFYSLFCSASTAPSCSADAVAPWAVRPPAMDICFREEDTVWLDDNATVEEDRLTHRAAGGLEDDNGDSGVAVSSAAVDVDDKDGNPSELGPAGRHQISYLPSTGLVAERPVLLEPIDEGSIISALNARGNLMVQLYCVLAGALGVCILQYLWQWMSNSVRSAWTSPTRKEAWRATRDYYRSWEIVTRKAMRFLAEDWRDLRAQPVGSWMTWPPPTRAGLAVRLALEVRWGLWMLWLGANNLLLGAWMELYGTTPTPTTTQPTPRDTQPIPRVTNTTPGPYAAEDWQSGRVYPVPVRARPVRQRRPTIQDDGVWVWAKRCLSDTRWWIWFVGFGVRTFWCELRKELNRTEFDDDSDESEEEEPQQPTTPASGLQKPTAPAAKTQRPKASEARPPKGPEPRRKGKKGKARPR